MGKITEEAHVFRTTWTNPRVQRISRGLRVRLTPTLFNDNDEYKSTFMQILNIFRSDDTHHFLNTQGNGYII